MKNVALFGAGRIGRIHAGNQARLPGVSRKYVCLPFGDSAAQLAQQLDALVAGRLAGDALVATMRGRSGTPRREPLVEARVSLRNDVSEDATVIEVFGRDRPGFLHMVARAHHQMGLEVRVAKVNTEGRRAADVFYVTARDGAKVPESRFDDVQAALLRAVEAT